MKFNDDFYISLAKPISKTEDTKCRKAIDRVVEALKKDEWTRVNKLKDYEFIGESSTAYKTTLNKDSKEVRIIIQGSYANSTNVRQESDVDIAVILTSTFRPKYRKGISRENYGFIETTYGLDDFRGDVFKTLKRDLKDKINKGCKSLKIKESSVTVSSDVVPSLQRRDYTNDYDLQASNFIGGIVIKDFCEQYEIINFPEQHIINGIKKNSNTRKRYKKMVRIFKNLKYKAITNGYELDKKTSSFLIESMVYNVPNETFLGTESLKEITRRIINYWETNKTLMNTKFEEANGIRKLFLSIDGDQDNDRLYGKSRLISVLKEFLEV